MSQLSETGTEQKPVVLLVDDDETFCLVLQRAMQKRGFEAHVALNQHEAEVLTRTVKPGYAVVDLRIGHESGLNVVTRLKQQNSDMKILMLTGYASIATAVEAIKLGATHYLTKPADADEIVTAFARNGGDTNVEITETPLSTKRVEWEHLQRVLIQNKGNISATARALNMHRRTLQRKLAKRPVKE